MEKQNSQDLIEYIEQLTKPPGLVLTLGKIEVSIRDIFLFTGKHTTS